MDKEKLESKEIVEDIGQVNGVGRKFLNGRNSSDLDYEVVLNYGEIESTRGENGVSNMNVIGFESKKSVNQDTIDLHVIDGKSQSEQPIENSSNLVGESKDSGLEIHEPRSRDVVINLEHCSGQVTNSEPSIQVVHGSSRGSSNSVDDVALETVIFINSEQTAESVGGNEGSELKDSELASDKQSMNKPKAKVTKEEKQLPATEKKCSPGGGIKETGDGESVCRICHLSSEGQAETDVAVAATNSSNTMDLIQLGCGCKDELGTAHAHCAEAWFKLKGNRVCEICGETAKNIIGFGDNRFMEEWNGRRSIGHNNSLSERGGGCWRGQPFCNFLMACLVIAFVLPWFFRVNMF